MSLTCSDSFRLEMALLTFDRWHVDSGTNETCSGYRGNNRLSKIAMSVSSGDNCLLYREEPNDHLDGSTGRSG